MIFNVEVSGVRRIVNLKRVGSRWVVTIDDRSFAVDAKQVAGQWSLLVSAVGETPYDPANGLAEHARSYEVLVEGLGTGQAIVHVGDSSIPLSVSTSRQRWRQGASGGSSGHQSIVTPMPGRVIRVLVQQGDSVSARQGLVVVEAMKMENELRAPRAGRVLEIRVTEGTTVSANTWDPSFSSDRPLLYRVRWPRDLMALENL